MKTRNIAKKGLYIGAGIGVLLFAILGFLPGSFIGGVIGLNIATSIFGAPLGTTLLPRMVVGASMLLGVFISGLVFVLGSSLIGWIIGYSIESLKYSKIAEIEKTAQVKKQ